MEVSKRPQRVAAACTWLMLGLAVVGVLISGRDAIGSVTINAAALLAGLGVAAVGAAIITAVSLTELDNPLLQPNGLVVDLGRLVYLGGITGALVAGHGVATPLWALYLPVLLSTAFTDIVVKAIAYAIGGLREFGYSWAEIGSRLGVTRQAAQQRWGGQS